MQLIIAVTLANIAMKKPSLLFRRMSSKTWIAALNRQEGNSVQSQQTKIKSTLCKAVLLLCYFGQLKHRGCKNTALDWLNVSHTDLGSRTSVASRTKFFVTTASGWEPLAVVTKKSILVPTGVLDQPLLELEMSKLNKHRMKGREIY